MTEELAELLDISCAKEMRRAVVSQELLCDEVDLIAGPTTSVAVEAP